MALALVPAAGRSRRMGRPKLLLPYRGSTVLGALIDALAAGGAEQILVVAAPDDAELAAWVADRSGSELAINPEPERGMLSSIQAGIEACGGGRELERRHGALLVCPGDHPALRPDTVRRLLTAGAGSGRALRVPVHRGRRGHPLLIEPPLIREIPRLDPARGLRQLLYLHPGQVQEIPVDDPGVLADLDTPADYRRLTGEGGGD